MAGREFIGDVSQLVFEEGANKVISAKSGEQDDTSAGVTGAQRARKSTLLYHPHDKKQKKHASAIDYYSLTRSCGLRSMSRAPCPVRI